MAQPRIRAQGAQQRVLEHVLGLRVARELARVHEQLVAVALDEGPEGWEHTLCNARRAGRVSYRLPPYCAARCSAIRARAVFWRLRPMNAITASTTTTSRKP